MGQDTVILGAGYAGILAALSTRKELTADAAAITTELHMPAAGSARDEEVCLPLDKLLSGKGIDVVIGEVEAILPDEHEVRLHGDTSLHFDILIVALGSQSEYFGIPGLQEHSLTLKSVDEARYIRGHIEQRFEAYQNHGDPAELTFAADCTACVADG